MSKKTITLQDVKSVIAFQKIPDLQSSFELIAEIYYKQAQYKGLSDSDAALEALEKLNKEFDKFNTK